MTLPQSPATQLVASVPGTGLELTLDSQLQYESEQALAKAIETSDATSGTAVVMDVKTGQVLSMANLVATHPTALGAPPAATPADPGGVGTDRARGTPINEASRNLAVTQLYEPGSVFKLVTFSAALQDGLINPNSVFTVPRPDQPGRVDLPRCRVAHRPSSSAPRRSWPSPPTSGPA